MNEKVVSFFRFAGFGKTAKDLSDQEIVELYKKVKEQLAETSGEANPVLDSATSGPEPMGEPETPDLGMTDDINPDEADQTAEGTEPASPADATTTIDSPELAPTEGSAIQPDMDQANAEATEEPNAESTDAYDPEQDEELQAMLNELGLGDDEQDHNNTGETGSGSDAGGAPGPVEQKPSPVDDSIQVNSAEESEELGMDQLKTMFGVAPQVEEPQQEEQPVVEEKEASVEQPAPVQPAPQGKKDEVATFLNDLGEVKPTEEPKPVEEKQACADPVQAEQPLSEIADEFEVVSQPDPDAKPVAVGTPRYFSSETPDNVAPSPKAKVSLGVPRQQEVDISDFTIAGKGRVAMKGFQVCRKDKDTMADGITRPDHDEGEGIKPPRDDLKQAFGADFKKKSENRDADLDSDKDLKVASIAEKVAFEFDTQDALDKYLEQHPKADKSNHWVDRNPSQSAPQAQQPAQHSAPVTKQKAQNDAYKILGDSIKGFFRDTDWSGARSVFKKLQDSGFKIDHLGVDDSGYKLTGGYKRWRTNLLHPSGRELNCTVTAHSAGEISDPYSRYDLSVVIQ